MHAVTGPPVSMIKRKHLFFLILFMEMVFIYVPDWGGRIYPFPLGASSISASSYVYYHFEHIVFVMLGWMLVRDSSRRELYTNMVFLGVLAFDYLDFVLTCNDFWGGTFMTGNIVKLAGFGLLTWKTDNE